MKSEAKNISEKLYIRNMVCESSKLFLKEKFEALGLTVLEISLGNVFVRHPEKKVSIEVCG